MWCSSGAYQLAPKNTNSCSEHFEAAVTRSAIMVFAHSNHLFPEQLIVCSSWAAPFVRLFVCSSRSVTSLRCQSTCSRSNLHWEPPTQGFIPLSTFTFTSLLMHTAWQNILKQFPFDLAECLLEILSGSVAGNRSRKVTRTISQNPFIRGDGMRS